MRPTTPGYKDGVETGNFLTEELYLGRLTDPLSLNRYNYVKSSAPNYVDPSGYYTNVQGTDAHETLFAYLEKYGDRVKTSYKVEDYEYSGTGVGYVDILFSGKGGWEVYELKTINEPFYRYWVETFGGVTGPQQRQGYIDALRKEGENVNESSLSLLGIFPLDLPSVKYPRKTIVYIIDPLNSGMMYWYYKNDKPAKWLALKLKEAEQKSETEDCAICNKAEDLVAAILAGYTIGEIMAYIAEATSATVSTIEAGLSSFFFFVPQPLLDSYERYQDSFKDVIPIA